MHAMSKKSPRNTSPEAPHIKHKSLKVGLLPSKENTLALTNAVFLSKADFSALYPSNPDFPYALLAEQYIYIAKVGSFLQEGNLAINGVQRKLLKVSVDDHLKVAPYKVEPEISQLIRLSFMIDSAQRNGEGNLKEEDVVNWIKQKMSRNVYTKGQQFAIEYQGTYYFLFVHEIEMAISPLDEAKNTHGSHRKRNNHGVIASSTDITVFGNSKNQNLKVKRSGAVQRMNLFSQNFSFEELNIGGLQKEFESIFRRAFASRTYPTKVIEKLGIQHVKGMLLSGPPGTGKTLIARQIGKMLHGKEPTVINGPEILNKYVGASEEKIRDLFKEAEQDYAANGEESELHIIIFDEIDAICKQRGSVQSGTGVHDTIVNQLLSKIDGVNSLNNILVIGMTNRKDLIDEALLRAGRLEVHVEVGLPDEKGRLEILKIHTKTMKKNKVMNDDIDLTSLSKQTRNFSGAEIEGLVKSASSFAISSHLNISKGKFIPEKLDKVKVTMKDFMQALDEVKPAFGVEEDELKNFFSGGIIRYSPEFDKLYDQAASFLRQLTNSRTPLLSVLLVGDTGTGKSALAAHLAINSGFPFTKVIYPAGLVGMSEHQMCQRIVKIFDDAHKSTLSLIVLDNIERLLQYVEIGPRFSNLVLQTLHVLIQKRPPTDKRLMIIGTSSCPTVLTDLEIGKAFDVTLTVPAVSTAISLEKIILDRLPDSEKSEVKKITEKWKGGKEIGIKHLLLLLETATHDNQKLTLEKFTLACQTLRK